MEKETLEIQVESDHINFLIKNKGALKAIEELIWNALDADANNIDVVLEMGGLGSDTRLVKVTVRDDGHGIKVDDGRNAFRSLGGSQKLTAKSSPSGRFYHGQFGKGRLTALCIGNKVTWRTRVQYNGQLTTYDLIVNSLAIKKTTRENERILKRGDTGTEVIIEQIEDTHPQLTDELKAVEQLERHLSLYLHKYPKIRITYNGRVIDPNSKVAERYSTSIPFSVNGNREKFDLTIVEWKEDAKVERTLHFCDEHGITVYEVSANINSGRIPFTAYLKSPLFKKMSDDSELFSMNADMDALIKETRKRLRRYFRKRQDDIQNEIIAAWKRANIYPYRDEEKDPVILVQEQVFNRCALTINKKLPGFRTSRDREKEMVFRLLHVALGNKLESVIEVLQQVLRLNQSQFEEFAEILKQTKLTAVIKSMSLVLERLAFIESTDRLLYSEFKEALLETQQLQKILRDNLWIFGEQYQLGIDDQRLKTLLKTHLHILERDEIVPAISSDIAKEELPNRRIDFMLYQKVGHPRKSDHLVIELKRPKVRLGLKEINQIRQYAILVANDERFTKEKVHWTFVLLGNELDKHAETECNASDREFGHIFAGDGIDIYVKRWSDIIEDAKWRYDLFYKNLKSEATDKETQQFLQNKYGKHLPDKKKKAKKKAGKKFAKKTSKKVRKKKSPNK